MAISNLTLAKPGLNTTKIEGFSVTASNITSNPKVTKHELSDIYWITSEMKLLATGGNSKLVTYCDTINTKIMNPNVYEDTIAEDRAVGDDQLVNVAIINSKNTFPATKRYAFDSGVCIVTIDNSEGAGYVTIGDENNGNPIRIQMPNDNTVLPVTVLDVAYRTNRRGSVSAAALCKKGTDYILYIGTSESHAIDYTGVIASKLYCSKEVVLILEKADSVTITRYAYDSDDFGYEPVTIFKTDYTYLKVMNPFSDAPTYVGYKTDGVYVNNTRVIEEVGIRGMAVNLVVNENYTPGWIYKQADGTCRDQAGHKVATITGDMNLGYLYQTYIINDKNENLTGV